MSGQTHVPFALTPGKEPPCPLYWRLVGLQSRSGRGGKMKNSWPCSQSNLDLPARSTVTILIELQRKNYTYVSYGLRVSSVSCSLLIYLSRLLRPHRLHSVEWMGLEGSSRELFRYYPSVSFLGTEENHEIPTSAQGTEPALSEIRNMTASYSTMTFGLQRNRTMILLSAVVLI
jgi:hypothetical protein